LQSTLAYILPVVYRLRPVGQQLCMQLYFDT